MAGAVLAPPCPAWPACPAAPGASAPGAGAIGRSSGLGPGVKRGSGARAFAGSRGELGGGRSSLAHATSSTRASALVFRIWFDRAPFYLKRATCARAPSGCDAPGHTRGTVSNVLRSRASVVNRFLYAAHRWLAAVALSQLAIWTLTGLFFASCSIESVRGEHLDVDRWLEPEDSAALLAPSTALAVAAAAVARVDTLELRRTPEGPVWIARGPHHAAIRLDARSGAVRPVTRLEAENVARADQRGAPLALEASLVERDAPIEYRDHPLPAWRVRLADARGTVIWVDARTADVTARRNDLWRWYDFFWSLHIMDYRGRESFNHPLLIVAAALAALAVASGATLWIGRLVRRVRRGRPSRA